MACILSPYWSTFLLPLTVSPTRPVHAGLGKMRFVAAASENSALDREESGPGNASNQEIKFYPSVSKPKQLSPSLVCDHPMTLLTVELLFSL